MKEHGRLLVLKERLVKIIGNNDKLDIKTLALFQLKDFCRNYSDIEERMQNDLKSFKITSNDAIKAMDYH